MEYGPAKTYADLASRGVTVFGCRFKENRCLSLECGRIVGIDDSKFETEQERNTALVHEDGHFISGAFYVPFSEYQVKEKAEYRADKAAILRFIPYRELIDQLRKGNQICEIAEYFSVTEQYVLKAYLMYKDLGYSFS